MYGREKMDGTVELVAAARRKGALLPEAKRVDTWATKADRPLRREMAGELHTPLDVAVHASTNGRRMENLLYCSFQCKIISIGFFFGGSGEW